MNEENNNSSFTGLADRVFSSIAWSTVGRVGEQVSTLIISVILARLLTPEEFGIVAMVMILIGFGNFLSDAGLSSALVQFKDMTDDHAHSIFWISLIISVGMTLAVYIGAPAIASFYNYPELKSLSEALSFIFVISVWGHVPYALLQRQMRFDTLAQVAIVRVVVAGTVGITLASYGAGVWSLVAQAYAVRISTLFLYLIYTRWYPRFIYSMDAIRELWNFAVNILGNNLLNYWGRNLDNLMIGRFLSAASLGYYSRAYAIMLLPIVQISSVIVGVMFPAMSPLKSEVERTKQVFLRSISVLAIIVTPMMFGLSAVAYPFVLTIYGNDWVSVAPLIRVLSFVGYLQALTTMTRWVYLSQGRADWLFRLQIADTIITLIGISIGILIGSLHAVVFGLLIANLLIFYPAMMLSGSLLHTKFQEIAILLLEPIVASAIMVVAVLTTSYILDEHSMYVGAELAISVITGMIVYATYMILRQPAGFPELRSVIARYGI